MSLGSKHTLITAYAALATIAAGMIGYDVISRRNAPRTLVGNLTIESVVQHPTVASTARSGAINPDERVVLQ